MDASNAEALLDMDGAAVWDGGLVHLSNGAATSCCYYAKIMSKTCYTGSVIEATVGYGSQTIFGSGSGYQAMLQLIIAAAPLPSGDGAAVDSAVLTMQRKIHRDIDHTWWEVKNASDFFLADSSTSRQGAGAMRLTAQRGAGEASASMFFEGAGWTALDDYRYDPGTLIHLPSSDTTCWHVGVQLHPFYMAEHEVGIKFLQVLQDSDGDGLHDDLERFIGSDSTAADSDGDGAIDGIDPKPTDALAIVQLNLPVVCDPPRTVTTTSSGAAVFLHIGSDAQAGTCVVTWPFTLVGADPAQVMEVHVPLEDGTPLSSSGPTLFATRPGELHVVQLLNANFAPVIDSTFVQYSHQLDEGATFIVPLSERAFDVDDACRELQWSITSQHDPAELSIAIVHRDISAHPQGGVDAVFSVDTTICRLHTVAFTVTDPAGNAADDAFELNLLGGEGNNVLSNGAFCGDATSACTSIEVLQDWTKYTWGGLYQTTAHVVEDEGGSGRTAARIEGLAIGRAAIYQTITLAAGTYRVQFEFAHKELVGNDWGKTLDVLLLWNRDGAEEMIIVPIPTLGDRNWTNAQIEFSVAFATPEDVTFYLRHFGTGNVFFDSVSLSEMLCYPVISTPTLSVVESANPVNFEVPFQNDSDGVLCGYCVPASASEVCQRCIANNYTGDGGTDEQTAPVTLASFEEGDPMPFTAGGWEYDTEAFGSTGGADRSVNLKGTYASAYSADGLLGDWSAWDMLKVDVYSPNAGAVDFYVEIRDIQTTGYWSRVNWYTTAAPGFSQVVIPLQIFVGEKTVTVERRRLDLAHITRLVFAATACDCDIIINNVRLEAEPPYLNVFSTLIRFDIGTPASPIERGFTAITDASWYRARSGYGIDPGSSILRTEDRRHPTDLLRDWISFGAGGINIDLPNDEYAVWMVIEDPGYWEYYPSFEHRVVLAEGVAIVDETMDWSMFSARYFAHQDSEDLPSEDAFEKYVRTRYVPIAFDVTVGDAQLNVELETSGTYACALSSMVVFPTSERTRGEAFIEELWARMKTRFDYEYVQAAIPSTGESQADRLDVEQNQRPFSLFSRPLLSPVRSFDRPAVISGSEDLNLFAAGLTVGPVAKGEVVTTSFVIRTEGNEGRTLTSANAVISGAIGPVLLFTMRSKFIRLSEGVYSAEPLLMDPISLPLALTVGTARRFIVQFEMNTAGCHAGTVELEFSDGSASVPISVTVSTVELAPVPEELHIGYLGTAPIVTGTPFSEMKVLQKAGFEASVALLKGVGATGIAGGLGGPVIRGYDENGEIDIDFEDANTTMGVLSRYWGGDRFVNSYFGLTIAGVETVSVTWAASSDADVFGRPYATVMSDALHAISAYAQENGWRPLQHNLADEPSDETALRAIEVASVFRAAGAGATTSVYTSFESAESVKVGFADDVDMVILNHHSIEGIAALKERNPDVDFMLYNQASRYYAGAYLWAVRRLGGKGHYQFALSSPGADPYYALDAREDDLCSAFLRSDGQMTPTMAMELTRAGIIDLRYLATLQGAIDTALGCISCSDAAAVASQVLADIETAMPVGRGIGWGVRWEDAELDLMRTNVIAAVDTLLQAGCGAGCGSADLPETCSPATAAAFTPLPCNSLGGQTADISSDPNVVGWWPLDHGWCDAGSFGWGMTPFDDSAAFPTAGGATPASLGGYGPLDETDPMVQMGASVPGLTSVDDMAAGITVEGWVLGAHGSAGNALFGFGSNEWGVNKLLFSNGWGFLWLAAGHSTDGLTVQFPRLLFDDCWHHVALVVMPIISSTNPLKVYVDGQDITADAVIHRRPSAGAADAGVALHSSTQIFGSAFGISPQGEDGNQRVDEVVLWSRALAASEIAERAASIPGGQLCLGPPPTPPTPPPVETPRCTPDPVPTSPALQLHVRVLSAGVISVVTDPTPYLHSEIQSRCAATLAEVEAQYGTTDPTNWHLDFEYKFAALEVVDALRPPILAALSAADGGLSIVSQGAGGGATIATTSVHLWPNAAREMRIDRATSDMGTNAPFRLGVVADLQFFSYLELDAPLDAGSYTVTDSFGNSVDFEFDDATSVSWALKVNQAGYPSTGPKVGYIGSWLGPGGAMDVSSWVGAAFSVRSTDTQTAVFTGVIELRATDTTVESRDNASLTGETVLDFDFSALTTPGAYYIQVDGLGRSWGFDIGGSALGEAFFTHARGLYHQRCGDLEPEFTNWPRNDAHVTYRGGHPPLDDDYRDHSAEGWGFVDEAGQFVSTSWFDIVERQSTEEELPAVLGGWHDAADFDRRNFHFRVVSNLVHTYLMYPTKFTDGQLMIPESGNGVPDILDEAAWGVRVWRAAQEADGRVSTWIEANSHPHVRDPGHDHQRYYLGLATRESSLNYATHAALVGRALLTAGGANATSDGEAFIASAERAFAFGNRTDVRVGFNYTRDDESLVFWNEPVDVDPTLVVNAAAQLWLATDDPWYFALLATPEMDAALDTEVFNYAHWQSPQKITLMTFALEDVAVFPSGWVERCRAKIVEQADIFLERQALNPYRKVWYTPTHGYFGLMAWGTSGWNQIRWLTAAYRLTNDARYRDGALHGVSWMHGTNPMGRPFTTGIGSTPMMSLLHLPSEFFTEPVPGITIYGIIGAIAQSAASRVYGLFEGGRDGYAGSSLAQMPPPWDNTAIIGINELKDELGPATPYWRRLTMLEAQNVPVSEFTVAETVAHAVAVIGALMDEGWTPSGPLPVPKTTRAEMFDGLAIQP